MLSKGSIPIQAASTPTVPVSKTFACAAFTVVFILLSLVPATQAQFARPGELPRIDAATRAAIVDSVTAAIDSIYVLEGPAKRIVAGLKKNLADGDYDDLTDPAELAERLYRDAQAINHDGHFRIAAMPPLDPAVAEAQQDEDPADVERRRQLRRARNYGFKKVEILPGGIGYLRFDEFAHGDEAFAAAAAAMNFLANSNALILDLRYNGGGSASMIRFICGYLFEENAHLINWDIRAKKKTVQSYSADYVPGRRITEQPVYILTSDRTFSAAEEFTFDLRNLERATVVGDTTGGGGHTVASRIFDFDGFRVGMRLPYGRAYNPKNNEGWEGVGVIPHIAVPAEQALITAQADALRKLIETEEDEQIIAGYQWGLTDLESRLNPIELTKQQMKQYVGNYGPRRIFIEDGALYYQREDRPRYKMEPMGEDLFRVGDLDYFRLTFERNKSGKVVKIIGLYDNGRTDEHERDKG
ncbi:MAG: hypothetical protein GTO29_14275 [Candidatus Latescibacteria bacterium]|nr:hypothetical protein [Candidatus Latescibacterota bacterium]NIO57313.1 hypothetical protein [Candidatus Latescibacterota bacterium]